MRNYAVMATVAALFAATSATAYAVTLNPRGLGQVLIYPYYTVNKGQDTHVSVVNVSGVGKVVKVQVLEGYNGRPVSDFSVFLSAHDIWTATISQIADDGGARIVSSDKSCVVPIANADGNYFRTHGFDFSAAGYTSSGPYGADGGPTAITRTREGHIEIFADADIVSGSPTDLKITHRQDGSANGGVPLDCDTLVIPPASSADVVAPTGGLYGSASIINVGEGTFFAYSADALSGFTDRTLLVDPGSLNSLADAHSVHSMSPDGAVATILTGSGDAMTIDYARGIDAVSAVFTAAAIYNDYLTTPALGAATDWVVTFPTKRFYVDPYYVGDEAALPFQEVFQAPGASIVQLFADIFDDEEGATSTYPPRGGCGIICPGSDGMTLPYEVNVLGIAGSATDDVPVGVLGSGLRTLLFPFPGTDSTAPGDSGSIRLDLSGYNLHALATGLGVNGQTVPLLGLPATGFMVENVINAHAQPGKLANYSGLVPHRTTVACVLYSDPQMPDPCG